MSTPAQIENVGKPTYELLKGLLKEANYDEALREVDRRVLGALVEAPDALSVLRFRCMISDVFDYGGRYSDAERILVDSGGQHIGRVAKRELEHAHDVHDIRDETLAKQQCWALIMWGMTFYRRFKLVRSLSDRGESAIDLFELARKIADILHTSSSVQCTGTLARAWYCVGLVHREQRKPDQARVAFRTALELTEQGIDERKKANRSSASFDFNMARAAGLGMSWIAYNQGSLTEATSLLALARRLMVNAKAKLISAYLDTLQAAIMMSGSMAPDHIQKSLDLLNRALATFAPKNEPGQKHTRYTLRCENEIALAYLRLGRACANDLRQKQKHFQEAQLRLEKVKDEAKRNMKMELRSYCTALITEVRLKRELGSPDDLTAAAKLAEEAKNRGWGSESTQVDACIGIGEVELARQAHGKAIKSFLAALNKGRDNRKDSAVCHLHLCNAYLLHGQVAEAREEFKLYESVRIGLENAFISDFASRLHTMLSSTFKNFELTPEDVQRIGNNKVHLDCLRRWLAQTALVLDRDDCEKAARRLHLKDPGTLMDWLKLCSD